MNDDSYRCEVVLEGKDDTPLSSLEDRLNETQREAEIALRDLGIEVELSGTTLLVGLPKALDWSQRWAATGRLSMIINANGLVATSGLNQFTERSG